MRSLNILFKTKGGHKEGMGDITSSIALATELKKHRHNILFITNSNDKVADIIKGDGFRHVSAETARQIECILAKEAVDIVILNQLNTPLWEAKIFRKYTRFLVTIDDVDGSSKLSNLKFNVFYPIPGAITDFRYVSLASTFQRKHLLRKLIKKEVTNILVTQGGSDTYGFTPKIIRALYTIPEHIAIKVVLGPHFANKSELDKALKGSPREFILITGTQDLSGLMIKADLAISAGGNTLFELACLGVPAVVVCGELFEVGTANRLQKNGFGINLGFGKKTKAYSILDAVNVLSRNHSLRLKMSRQGRALIDGNGSKRIAEKIKERFLAA